MNRRYCLVFGAVVLASCSSTDAPPVASGGASAVAGAATAGSPAAGGSGGASNPGGSAGATVAGSGNTSGAPSAGAGGAAGASSGAGGAAPTGGAAGANGGAAGASGASGAAGAGGSAGKGGAGNGGSAGAPAKFCDGKTLSPSPVIVTDRFDDEAVGKDLPDQLSEWVLPDACDDVAENNAVGSCHEYEYTPEPDGGTVKWQWVSDPAGIKYAPVCMAAGMTKVMFRARGYVGGEKVTFGASQATPIEVTLTTTWTQYSISLTNVKYNSDSQGVQPGFYWTLVETENPGKASVRFDIDDIKYVDN